ncbi:MAG: S9 family peptidase [Actinomycetota bacterium]
MANPDPAVAPIADRTPVTRSLWGDDVVDSLGWLRDRDDPAVLAVLEAENAHTEALLGPVADLRNTLFDEIKGRIRETDLSVPVPKDGWAYYTRTVEGAAYPIHCRRPFGADADLIALIAALDPDPDGEGHGVEAANAGAAEEQILLDENAEADGHEFFDVGPFDVSPDHRLMLWGWDTSGDERFTARIRDLERGVDLDDELTDIGYATAWALDNQTVFYVRQDEANRPHEVWRHRLGTPQSDDVRVYHDDDERFFVGVGREKDDSFIQIGSSSKITDEVHIVPADDPTADLRPIALRRQGVEYAVSHHGDQFVILTNDRGHQNFTVMTVSDVDPGPENWSELDLGRDHDVMLSDIDVTADHMVLFERADGLTRMRVRRWDDGSITEIDQPESPSTVWPGANPDYRTGQLRYGYSSMVTPPTVFSLDLASGERTVLKQQPVLGDFDATRYVTQRLWATADDGTRVPISIVARADRPSEPGPCLLYAYGAYEVSIDPTFSAARLSLLDRGFAFAIAHARGGGEMGRAWYEAGKFEAKATTFDDVIACGRHLVASGWTTPNQLALRGGSAGGLMAGAVINRAPDLFAAAVAQVAFVDALNTMLDPSLPLTVTEWEEWGNPAESEAIYQAMRAYSPYENIGAVPYPSVLATGGLNDTRVGYWEPAKWVQELRRITTGPKPILLWTDLGAGHGGPSGRYDAWAEEARILAYILWALGLAT